MRTKQVRPEKLEFEYELHISREHDPILKKDYILFDFRTKKVFENFVYRLNVIPEIRSEKLEIEFNIEGLSAPRLDISKSGNAGYQYRFFDFKNAEYELILLKYAKGKIHYGLKISGKSVKVTKHPKKTFIKILTGED